MVPPLVLGLVILLSLYLYVVLLYTHYMPPPPTYISGVPNTLPPWMESYVRWHRDQLLHNSSETRYLIYTCTPREHMCGGIGHRFGLVIHRGLLLAIATQRVFLIECTNKRDLREVLSPNLIHWAMYPDNYKQMPLYDFKKGVGEREDWYKTPESIAGSKGERIIRYFSTEVPGTTAYFEDLVKDSPAYSINRLAWEVLFQPTDAVKARMADLRRQAGISGPYVAVQMRMGHVEGENNWVDPVRHGLSEVEKFYNCTKALQRPEEVALVLSDSDTAKAKLVAMDPTFRMLDTDLFHIDRGGAPGKEYQGHVDAFAELLLLAGSRSFVRSVSGFSNMAAAIGHADTVSIESC